ncbi:hypothetical protein ABVK25_007695 [Lepraria finkii]|uniref:RING-type domain-containing protein n=1 Tax=Lepraria finkii TaxID=1340010 RepID=A0ABR4B285_9LECA
MPFLPLDREVETYSSGMIEERIPDRFDDGDEVESNQESRFSSTSPEVHELDASGFDNREEEESHHASEPESPSLRVYELDAPDMNELDSLDGGLRIETEPDIDDDIDETWPPVSELSVEVRIEPFLLSMPNAIRFLRNLDFLDLEDLSEESRYCLICKDSYVGEEECEGPVMLDCRHVFGHRCLEKWLSPYDFDPKRTCPMCRAVLFEEDGYPVSDIPEDSTGLPSVHEEAISEEDIDEDIEYSEAADLMEAIASTNRVVEAYDQARAMQLTISVGTETEPILAEVLPSRHRIILFSADILFYFRLLVRPNHMSALETREIALAIRNQMGQLYVRLQESMREMQMPIVWREDGPPLSFLLDPAAQPLLESALERMGEIEEVWDWSEIQRET